MLLAILVLAGSFAAWSAVRINRQANAGADLTGSRHWYALGIAAPLSLVLLAVTFAHRNARKHAEEALTKRDILLGGLLDSIPAIVFFKDGQGVYLGGSTLFVKYVERSREEIFGHTDYDLFPRQIADAFRETDRLMIECGAGRHNEEWIEYHDGRRILLDTYKSPLRLAPGEAIGVIGFARDITERKLTEEALRQSERFLQSTLDALSAHIAILDDQGVITAVSAAWNRFARQNDFLGSQHGIGVNYLTLCESATGDCAADAAAVATGIRAVMSRQCSEFSREYPCHSPQEQRWFLMRVTRFSGDGPVRVVVAHEDISARKQFEEELQWKTAFLQAQVNASIDGILVVDGQGTKVLQNQRTTDLFKIPQAIADEQNNENQRRWVMQAAKDPDDFIERVLYLNSHPNEIGRDELEMKDGTVLDRYSAPILGKAGKCYGRIWTFRDVTQRKMAEKMLRVERENLTAILAAAPVGLLLLDEETVIVRCNAVIARMVGRNSDQIKRRRIGDGLGCMHSFEDKRGCGFSPACKSCRLRTSVCEVLHSGNPIHVTEMLFAALVNGKEHAVSLSVSAEPVSLDGRTHVIVALHDITDRTAMEEELRTAARTDKLTGLPNRTLFCDRLQRAVLRAKRHTDYHFAVLFLDFDRFKTINDSLGHGMGDRLLQEIARRLCLTVRSGDSPGRHTRESTAARLGGDEFVVLLDGLAKPGDATAVADRLLEALAQPYHLGDHEVYSTASIGIVTSDMAADSAEDVLRDADTAMYEAKLAGKGQYVVFDVSMRQCVQNRLNLETELHKALELDQLFLMYQPIVSLQTGQLVSFEALIRWQHPQRGLISPGEFIPIAEDTGLILPIGAWVLQEACRQFMQWRQVMGDHAPGSISVNISRNQLMLPNLPGMIRDILAQTGMTPGSLHLEVTESAVMKNAAAATRMLHAIKDIGVKLDMDDFGTGYSSLACLREFPIDVLKIDRSFVAAIDRGRDFAALVHSVAQLARNLNVSVVAEGIETAEQALMLQSLECEFGQGYLFSKPLLADQVVKFRVPQAVLPGLVG